MVMGDTVVFQDEVTPAIDAAFANGLEVTGLHNHFFFDEPKVYFMHAGGSGDTTVSATPPARRNISVSRETNRGPRGTMTVPLGPQDFAARTLALSGYHPSRSYQPVSFSDPKRNGYGLSATRSPSRGIHKAPCGLEGSRNASPFLARLATVLTIRPMSSRCSKFTRTGYCSLKSSAPRSSIIRFNPRFLATERAPRPAPQIT